VLHLCAALSTQDKCIPKLSNHICEGLCSADACITTCPASHHPVPAAKPELIGQCCNTKAQNSALVNPTSQELAEEQARELFLFFYP